MCCPDCKDGFYYPLIGPPENCQTCNLEKPQAEDRMHRAKLSEAEFADMEAGCAKITADGGYITGISFCPPDIAKVVENRRMALQVMLDHHEEDVLKAIEQRNLNIQGTTTDRMESTPP